MPPSTTISVPVMKRASSEAMTGKKDRFHIVFNLLVEGLFGDFRSSANVIHRDVDAAEFLPAGLHHDYDLGIFQHVADMGRDLSVFADARHRLDHRIGIVVDSENLRSLAREHNRGGAGMQESVRQDGSDTGGRAAGEFLKPYSSPAYTNGSCQDAWKAKLQ